MYPDSKRKGGDADAIPLQEMMTKRTRATAYNVDQVQQQDDGQVEINDDLDSNMEQGMEVETNQSFEVQHDLPWNHDLDMDAVGVEIEDHGLCDIYSIAGSTSTNSEVK